MYFLLPFDINSIAFLSIDLAPFKDCSLPSECKDLL
jgi:hypothetical protein